VPTDNTDLCFEFHYGNDLVEGDVLRQLQAVLGRLAPKLSAVLEVHSYERDRDRRPVDPADPDSLRAAVLEKGVERGDTFDALTVGDGAGRARRFGGVLLRGRGPKGRGVHLSIDFDSQVPARWAGDCWLWSNSIAGFISSERVEGVDRQQWVSQLAAALAETTEMLWGAAYLQPEFTLSNLDTSGNGLSALGRDVRTSLPGIYWLNIFGAPYVALIGSQRLVQAPAHLVTRRGSHVIVQAYRDAADWSTHDEARRALVAALGVEYFFDRNDQARRYRAPDFGLPELPATEPFEVFTNDGIHFTPLQ
jgi:hypothetical protein